MMSRLQPCSGNGKPRKIGEWMHGSMRIKSRIWRIMKMKITIEEAARMVGLTRGAVENWSRTDALEITLERSISGHGPGLVRCLDKAEFEAVARRRGYLK